MTASTGATRRDGGVVTLGETMGLLVSTDAGPLGLSSRSMRLAIAGAESNVAVGVRRLGYPATWIGRVGEDALGDLVLRELRAENVRCFAVRDPAPTGLMLKHRRTADVTQVSYYRAGSAGSRLRPADVPVEEIQGAGVLHVTGITLALGEDAAAAVRTAVATARDAGVTVSLDVNYRSALWDADRAAAALTGLLGDVDVLFAGLSEAQLLVPGDTPEEVARALADIGLRQVVIKLGEHGCHALIDGTPYTVPATKVTTADPVGAGDAFVAGYLADLLTGRPPAERLVTATRVAAFAVATSGDWEGLPRQEELSLIRPADNVLR